MTEESSSARGPVDEVRRGLFKLLSEKFDKMPPVVQVLAYLSLLFLFIFLVLHAVMGVTYFEGKVYELTQEGHPPYARLKINNTLTNEEGRFLIGVHRVYFPFVKVDFCLGEEKEELSVRLVSPFSMFSPKSLKIYHVKESRAYHHDLPGKKHYFTDADEAREALGDPLEAVGPLDRHTEQARAIPYMHGQEPLVTGVAYANGGEPRHEYDKPTYTLRIQRLKTSNIESATEVYFEIWIDGRIWRFDHIPHSDSGKLDLLTIFPEDWNRFDTLEIPLQTGFRTVEVSLFSKRFLRDRRIGTAKYEFETGDVGGEKLLRGWGLELMIQLLPPASIGYRRLVPRKYLIWLDISSEHLDKVTGVQYDSKISVQQQQVRSISDYLSYLTTSVNIATNKWELYAQTVTTSHPNIVYARVVFEGKPVLNLLANLDQEREFPRDHVHDYYFEARALHQLGRREEALEFVDRAMEMDPDFLPAAVLRGEILGGSEAIGAYRHALERIPDDPSLLDRYVRFITDELEDPSIDLLGEAREYAERAVEIQPDARSHDTLGWVLFKLGDYDGALEKLTRAERILEERANPDSPVWKDINYHLAQVYLKRDEHSEEAKDAYVKVINRYTIGIYFLAEQPGSEILALSIAAYLVEYDGFEGELKRYAKDESFFERLGFPKTLEIRYEPDSESEAAEALQAILKEKFPSAPFTKRIDKYATKDFIYIFVP